MNRLAVSLLPALGRILQLHLMTGAPLEILLRTQISFFQPVKTRVDGLIVQIHEIISIHLVH